MADSANAPEPVTSLVGLRLGDLEVVELLSESETTAVYRARDSRLNRQVAVKVLAPHKARDAAAADRFRQAALAAAAVEHPNIVHVLYAGEQQGLHYVVMELVRGESLAALLKQVGRLDPDRALDLMKQAAAGLAHAHEAGVVHGDIQPSNLLLSEAGLLKIADFSLARCEASPKGPTAASTPPSAPLYFPPEAAHGRRLDARSDLYLLGATFYHLLAGHPPFEADSPEALALRHVREEPPPLNAAAPNVPLALCHVIHHLLRRDPDERFHTARDLVAALERIEAELEAERNPPMPPVPAPPRSPWSRVLVGAAAVALLLAAVYVVRQFGRQRPTPPPAGRPGPSTAATPSSKSVGPPPRPDTARQAALPEASSKGKPKTKAKTRPPQPPPWQKAWETATRNAASLARDLRYGEALGAYENLAAKFDDADLHARIEAAKAALAKQADAVFRQAAQRAKQFAQEKRFGAARMELQVVIERFGLPALAAQAAKLLADVQAQEAAAKAAAAKAAAKQAEAARRREAQQRLAEVLQPAEKLARQWAFAAAAQALAKAQLPEPHAAAKIAARLDEFRRLAQLKAKIIARINTATPKLRKSDVRMPGLNATLVSADDTAIVASIAGRQPERHPWTSLSSHVARNLALAAIDQTRPDHWLATGLLDVFMNDLPAAEKDFAKARSLGAEVGPYVGPLAEAALARAEDLAARADFRAAAAALDRLEANYAGAPWLAANRHRLAAARARVKLGLAEALANDLLARADKALKAHEPFEARRLLELLERDHPTSLAVTDAARKPSFAELKAAVAGLGRFVAVRKDGTGDAASLAEALRLATPKGMVEIQDGAVYEGAVLVTDDKAGLRIRGKPGSLPVITASPAKGATGATLEVQAADVRIEDLAIVLDSAAAPTPGATALLASSGPLTLRRCIIAVGARRGMAPRRRAAALNAGGGCDIAECVVVGPATLSGDARVSASMFLAGALRCGQGKLDGQNLLLAGSVELLGPADLRLCTSLGQLTLQDQPNTITDSILSHVTAAKRGTRIANCTFFASAQLGQWARADRTCSFITPQFVDPRALDFRLRPNSSGRRTASDRGGRGCRRWPPQGLRQRVLAWRRQGKLAF